MKITALIMAGGKGERFWPKSREKYPKQFIDVCGCGKTMIQLTVERILPIIEKEDIYIVTNEKCREVVKQQLPYIPEINILCEPVGKNTAPCIGLGAIHILKRNQDSVMIVLPSDHLIREEDLFRSVLQKAVLVAEKGHNVVTVGTTANRPETNYGYIRRGERSVYGTADCAEQFVEKPDLQTALRYLQDGNYLWNCGIFVWKTSTVLELFREYIPDIYEHILRIGEGIGAERESEILQWEYSKIRPISIDYGVMEHAENIYVLAEEFGWDDVGSWLAMERIKKMDEDGNVISGNVVVSGTHNCIIDAQKKLIAAVNLEDVIVVDTEDVILIGNKQKIGDVKDILDEIQAKNFGKKYL